MATNLYIKGFDVIGGGSFVSNTYKILVLKGSGYTFSADHQHVSDLTPGSNEVTESGYGRFTLTGKSRVVKAIADSPSSRIIYMCDNINCGAIATGEDMTSAVLFKFVTNDSDSLLVAQFTFESIDTAVISPFILAVDPINGLLWEDKGS